LRVRGRDIVKDWIGLSTQLVMAAAIVRQGLEVHLPDENKDCTCLIRARNAPA